MKKQADSRKGKDRTLPAFLQSALEHCGEDCQCLPYVRKRLALDISSGAQRHQSDHTWGYEEEEEEVQHLGLMYDRRKKPFCPGPNAHHTQAWIKQRRYKGNATFVFIISTGHSGTTYLQDHLAWTTLFGPDIKQAVVLWGEVGEGDKNGLGKIIRALPTTAAYCARALEYVHGTKIPGLLKSLKSHLGRTVGIQTGHETFLAMIPALILLLGDRAKFVRLRRNRLSTAYSLSASDAMASFARNDQARVKAWKSGPCTDRLWGLCPFDYSARLIPPGDAWLEFSKYQRNLWFVDELEAEWQSIMQTFPETARIELNWDTNISPEVFQSIADFAGLNFTLTNATARPHEEHAHTHNSEGMSAEDLAAKLQKLGREYADRLNLTCDLYTCVPAIHKYQSCTSDSCIP
jgi:hypothetical protein